MQEVKFHAYGGNIPYIPKGPIGIDQWVSAAILVAPTKAEIYVDGVLVD